MERFHLEVLAFLFGKLLIKIPETPGDQHMSIPVCLTKG